MNVVRLSFKTRDGFSAGQIELTHDELPDGVVFGEINNMRTFTTVEGFAKTYPHPLGRMASFSIVLVEPATIAKIDAIGDAVNSGYLVDVNVLAGMLSYNSVADIAQYSASRGAISNGEIVEFQRDWQNAIADGQQYREPCRVMIKAGIKESLPLPGDYTAPAPGGSGN